MRTLDEQIAHVKQKISVLAAKEGTYKNRRVKLENKLNGLVKRRDARVDFLHLTALRKQIKDDPEELAKLQEILGKLSLSDQDRGLLGLPPQNTSSTAAHAPDSGRDTGDTAAGAAANGTDPDTSGAPDPDGTSAAPPDSTTDTAAGKAPSPADPVDAGAEPPQPKAPPAGTNASVDPSDEKITEKQLLYLKDLVAKHPDQAKQIGIDAASLSTLSKGKASWAIKQLAPPQKSAPRSRSRR